MSRRGPPPALVKALHGDGPDSFAFLHGLPNFERWPFSSARAWANGTMDNSSRFNLIKFFYGNKVDPEIIKTVMSYARTSPDAEAKMLAEINKGDGHFDPSRPDDWYFDIYLNRKVYNPEVVAPGETYGPMFLPPGPTGMWSPPSQSSVPSPYRPPPPPLTEEDIAELNDPDYGVWKSPATLAAEQQAEDELVDDLLHIAGE